MYFRYDDIKVGDMVEIKRTIRDRYQIDKLIVGKRRISYIGEKFFISSKRQTADGRTRYFLKGTGTIPWSRGMFERIDREENEI